MAGGPGGDDGSGLAGEPPTGDAGAPRAEAGAPPSAAGAANGDGGSGSTPVQLTSCDEPLIVDDAPEASIAPNSPTIFQSPGGLTLLTWREGTYRKARVLREDDSLGSVITFPNVPTSIEHFPQYVASAPGRAPDLSGSGAHQRQHLRRRDRLLVRA